MRWGHRSEGSASRSRRRLPHPPSHFTIPLVPKLSPVSRRTFLSTALAGSAATLAGAQVCQSSPDEWTPERAQAALRSATGTSLVLLGTGAGPVEGRPRRMTSHVLVSDGAAYIVDCGLGVTTQLARTGIPFSTVRSIFITHHHPDHNVEYGPFLLLRWVNHNTQAPSAYGPPPLIQMTRDYLRSMDTTIRFWSEDFEYPPLKVDEVHEVTGSGPVMKDQNVRVTSVLVQHPPVHPALGYRFDFADRSIAFSGDTVPLEAVARLARGADVLVHEAIDMDAMDHHERAYDDPAEYKIVMRHMRADHSPIEDVGRIAQEAGVKTLVLSHLAPSIGVPDETWRAGAAKQFRGNILVGHDLMVI